MARGDNPDYRQSSFATGEIASTLYGRSDFKKYPSALRLCRNFFVNQHGALISRPGTAFVASVKDPTKKVRLVPFIFSDSQSYVLEFGDQYVRFYHNGAQIMTGAPPVPLEYATPYAVGDLPRLKFAQSGDVVTIAHQGYAPRDLKRLNTAGTSWSIAATPLSVPLEFAGISGAAKVASLLSVWFYDWSAINTSGAQAAPCSYAVTAVYANGGESLPIWTVDQAIDRTACKPHIVWNVDVGATDYRRPIAFNIYRGHSGVWGLLDTVESMSGISLWDYTDDGSLDPDFATQPPKWENPFPQAPGAWSAGNYYAAGDRIFANGNTYEAIRPGTAGGASAPAATSGVVYDLGSLSYVTGTVPLGTVAFFGGSVWHCTSTGTTTGAVPWQQFHATAINSVITDGAVWTRLAPGGYVTWKFVQVGLAESVNPAVVTYFDQRRLYATTKKDPSRIVGSQIGNFNNFDRQEPPLASDAIDFSLAAQRYEEIRSFVQLRTVLALTSERDWSVAGDSGGSITPTSILARPNNVRGASWLDPLAIGVTGLYVQALGTQIWELVFDFYTQGYLGNDVTMLAQHLFQGHQILDWAYAPVPYSLVWAVRDDGTLLGFTYVREQEVMAWHRHTTAGAFENVCTVPEMINGVSESGVYMVVQRGTTRNIERFASRLLPRLQDGTYDRASFLFLDAHAVTTGTAIKVATGLAHLNGLSVMALADGAVCGPYTVASGQIDISADFPDGVSKIVAGLPYEADMEMLDLQPEGTRIRSNVKNVYRVSFEVVESCGLWAGPDFDHLLEWEQRNVKDGYGNIQPFTGLDHVRLAASRYEHNGRIVIRQKDPLPLTIVAIGREVNLGGD